MPECRGGQGGPRISSPRPQERSRARGDPCCFRLTWRRLCDTLGGRDGSSPSFVLAAVVAAGCGRVPQIIVLEDPLTADEHVALGVSYEKKGDLALAAREYERALKKDPSSFPARFNLGNVRLAEKRYDAARDEYLEALKLRPGDAEATNNLSWAAILSGNGLEDALRRMEAVLSDAPRRSPPLLDTLGVLLGELSRPADAEKAFAEALARCDAGDASCTGSVRAEILEHRKALLDRGPGAPGAQPRGNREARCGTHRFLPPIHPVLRFHNYGSYLTGRLGGPAVRIPVDGGFTCPNRDGTIGVGGCAFCNNDSFSPGIRFPGLPVEEQVRRAISAPGQASRVQAVPRIFPEAQQQLCRAGGAPPEDTRAAFAHPDVAGIVVGHAARLPRRAGPRRPVGDRPGPVRLRGAGAAVDVRRRASPREPGAHGRGLRGGGGRPPGPGDRRGGPPDLRPPPRYEGAVPFRRPLPFPPRGPGSEASPPAGPRGKPDGGRVPRRHGQGSRIR